MKERCLYQQQYEMENPLIDIRNYFNYPDIDVQHISFYTDIVFPLKNNELIENAMVE